MGHWRNHRWGWNQRHIWLFTDVTGDWWVYVRVGTEDEPRKTWRHSFASEAVARQAIDAMISRAEQSGDPFSFFPPGERSPLQRPAQPQPPPG